MKKIIYRIAMVLAIGSVVTGCQSRMRQSEKTFDEITRETAVVENQMSNGVLIAYMPDIDLDLEGNGEDGAQISTQMDETVHLIETVTGGTPIRIGREENLPEDYGTVFFGIAGQVSELPEVLRTFVEEYDFSGKTMIPFLVTDGGDLETMRNTLYELEPETEFLDGISIDVTDSRDWQPEVNEWLSDLGYNN